MSKWRGDCFKGGGQGKPIGKTEGKDWKEARKVLHSINIYLPHLLDLAF
jgi:hypothetical protein